MFMTMFHHDATFYHFSPHSKFILRAFVKTKIIVTHSYLRYVWQTLNYALEKLVVLNPTFEMGKAEGVRTMTALRKKYRQNHEEQKIRTMQKSFKTL